MPVKCRLGKRGRLKLIDNWVIQCRPMLSCGKIGGGADLRRRQFDEY